MSNIEEERVSGRTRDERNKNVKEISWTGKKRKKLVVEEEKWRSVQMGREDIVQEEMFCGHLTIDKGNSQLHHKDKNQVKDHELPEENLMKGRPWAPPHQMKGGGIWEKPCRKSERRKKKSRENSQRVQLKTYSYGEYASVQEENENTTNMFLIRSDRMTEVFLII